MKASANLTSQNAIEKKEREKILTQLTLIQSILTVVIISIIDIYFWFVYAYAEVYTCYRSLMASTMEATYDITDLLNFYLVFILNRRFRQMILKAFPMLEKFSSTVSASGNA